MSSNSSKDPSVTYDVIVCGGGPAGVSCAYTLSKLGKSVILLDKKKRDLIGNKTCGDALDKASPLILHDEFGLELPNGDEVSDKVSKMTIITKNKNISLEAPGYTVDRLKYGQRLLKECENIGVTIIDQASVRDVIIENNHVVGVKYFKDRKEQQVRAKLTADCTGLFGAVRSKLPQNFSYGMHQTIPDYHIAASVREIVTLTKDHVYPEEIVLEYDPNIPPPGYLWFFTKGEKRLNIGTGWLKSEHKEFGRSMKVIYKEALNNYYKEGEDYVVDDYGGGQIPIRPPYDCMTFNGGLIIGDAACQVDPTTAEGHGPALVNGYYAGKVMNQAIANKDLSREGLWKYNIDVMAHYGRRNAISYVTLQFLREIQANGMDFILRRRILTEEELIAVFDGEDIKLNGLAIIKKVIRAFPNFSILKRMKQLVHEVQVMGDIYNNYPDDPSKLSDWIEERDNLLGEKL